MNDFKFNVLVVVVFVVLGGIVYWSVSSMNNDVYYTRDIANADPVVVATNDEPVEIPTEVVETPEPVETVSEHADLIAKIEKLVSDKIYMKSGSQGTRVGTVQEFLNLYNGTSNIVDNDYGPGTKQSVINFQTAEGLGADGETGPNTYAKMIEWLESN